MSGPYPSLRCRWSSLSVHTSALQRTPTAPCTGEDVHARRRQPYVGLAADACGPLWTPMIRLWRTARGIVLRLPGLLRRGAASRPIVHGHQPVPGRCVRAEDCFRYFAERPARLAVVRRQAFPGGLSVHLLPGKAGQLAGTRAWQEASTAGTEPLRPMPSPAVPAYNTGRQELLTRCPFFSALTEPL